MTATGKVVSEQRAWRCGPIRIAKGGDRASHTTGIARDRWPIDGGEVRYASKREGMCSGDAEGCVPDGKRITGSAACSSRT